MWRSGNVHRKELTFDLGEQRELVELVVFRGKRINYCTSMVRSVFILREKSELSKLVIGTSVLTDRLLSRGQVPF